VDPPFDLATQKCLTSLSFALCVCHEWKAWSWN